MSPLYLHITPTDGRFESRMMKEARSGRACGLFSDVLIIARAPVGESALPLKSEASAGITLERIPVVKLFPGLTYLFWQLRVFLRALAVRPGVTSIHHIELLPLGCAIKLCSGSKLIYDTHEVETETILPTSNPAVKAGYRLIEALFLRHSDEVIVVNHHIKEWYAAAFPGARITSVLNAPNYKSTTPNNYLRELFGLDREKRIFLYQGLLTQGRGIPLTLDIFRRGLIRNGVVVFMGYGPCEAEVMLAAGESPNIFFHAAVPPTQLLEVTASADFGLCLIEPACLSYRITTPNKALEYVMAGVPPVVSTTNCFHLDLITDWKVGVAVDLTVDSVVDSLNAITAAERQEMSEACILAAKELCWERQEPSLVAVYQRQASPPLH